jgi:MoaA/NifB/PqqE/SkfB family radical SAM enzyme
MCNRKCPFCYGPEKLHEVRAEESQPVLAKMIDLGIRTFILTGGEPLLGRKIDEVLRFLRSYDAQILLYTNCDYFDLHEDVLVECLDTLCVPIEGASEYVHDSVRGRNNMRAVLSVLDRYGNGAAPFKIKVGTVLGRHNLNELSAILYLLDKYKINVWKLYNYVRYTDRDVQSLWDKKQLGISDAEYRTATQVLMAVPERRTPVALSSEFDRDNSYFMMNPDLNIVAPIRNQDGLFEDKVICSARDHTPREIVRLWRATVDWSLYADNLRASLF